MSAKETKKSVNSMVLKGAWIFNPVLIQTAGICPAVAASTDFISALYFTVLFTVITFLSCFVACAALKKVPRWVRVAVYMLLGIAVIFPALRLSEVLEIGINARIQVYLPLLAVNSVTAVHCEQYSVKHSIKDSMIDAFAVCLGFGTVLLLTGAIREILAYSSIAAVPLNLPVKLSGMVLPFGCFIILGYLAMFLRWYISKYHPKYLELTSVKIKETEFGLRKEKDSSSDYPDEFEDAPDEPEEPETVQPEEPVNTEPEEIVFDDMWTPEAEEKRLAEEKQRRIDELLASLEAETQNLGKKNSEEE